MNKNIQLNKYLANLGISSRRKIADLVDAKRVKVNGQIMEKLGIRIDPEVDQIEVDGKKVGGQPKLTYLILNKPKGIVSTVADEHGRKTVIDLIHTKERLYPVGRLDQDSVGLVMLTNDGDLTQHLTHPSFHIPKTYHVLISGEVSQNQLEKLRNGVVLKDGKTAPAQVEIVEQSPKRTLLQIIIHEGKNRQIRRMCGALGLNLLELKRVAIGPINLGDLKMGSSRFLNAEEIQLLKEEAKMTLLR